MSLLKAKESGDLEKAKIPQRLPTGRRIANVPAVEQWDIGTKIQNGEYEHLPELEDDLIKMTKNAMLFNEPGSQIYKDAKNIHKLVKSKKLELEANKVARENRGARSTRRLHGRKHYSADVS